MTADPAIAAAYREFARAAQGRSPLYVEIASGVAEDEMLLARVTALPKEKQQPNLLLAAAKYLFGTARDWPQFRERVESHWDAVQVVMLARRTQTNEPARCATLLPLLALLPQPLALLEVGASAGLCLLPDKYAYDYDGHLVGPTKDDANAPLFHCIANDATPLPKKNIEVVWRAGLDLNPLDVRADGDVRWLHALVWPGEGEREKLLDQALAVARADPPRIGQGDLRHDLAPLAASAPKDATLVIFHSAVLNYVADAGEREAFVRQMQATRARWISNEGVGFYDLGIARAWPAGSYFILALDGKAVARTESHGASIEWFA
ncbi:MAG TPA: DUF2332 domain-containing protein [Rhizomicrobium sp.]|nr:DUF2332 domain-containing protein [Rhizomicrobium sp.]